MRVADVDGRGRMIPKIIATSDEFCKRLLLEGEKKGAVELSGMFESFAMDTTAALVYSLDLNTHENLDHPLVKCCKGFFGNLGGWKMILLYGKIIFLDIVSPEI
ncbi:hypothetical protein IscW_ISCW002940 [Ixodes scapularis]|uniref:Uncharacterized protein n=1 Tax=Ixodes scapularis TaxID=6945 RepID=B7P9Q7_IXOSC|nr:hypothetical protein IscW_ISCW002940 [Ixodes scapularis]|eukprot:XP_002405128.1 hypothetical protein IscW_ISCW002940 [Ixodes scapularis]